MALTSAAPRHPGTEHLLGLFEYDHLPPHLQAVSAPCADLAVLLVGQLEDGPELTVALRKLLEAKDCAVRQAVLDHRAAAAERERIATRDIEYVLRTKGSGRA